jgi:hypothetical protein
MEESLTLSEVFVVLAVAAAGFVIFGYWLRGSVLVQMAKKAKHKRRIIDGGPRWVGPGFSRRQRRH